MVLTFNSFRNKWNEISVEGYIDLDIKHPLTFSIGINHLGNRSFIISEVKLRSEIPSTSSVTVKPGVLNGGCQYVEFYLTQNEFIDEFYRLCWDFIDSTIESNSPIHTLLQKYHSWLKLLQNKKNEIMSFNRQKGLLGELLYFDALIDKGLSSKDVINSWVGPEGADQDFVFKDSWSEVKSVSLSSETVKISSIQQLDQEINGHLIIQTLEKTPETNKSINLPTIVKKVRSKINDVFLVDRFDTKLFKYGYREEHESDYALNNFMFYNSANYLVDSRFPRLTRKIVPIEIEQCKYEISIPAIAVFEEK